jgi:hypothetical protein
MLGVGTGECRPPGVGGPSLGAADRLGDLVGGSDERPHPRVDRGEPVRREVGRAAGDLDAVGVAQRAPHRLARPGLRLGRDAAGVDHVQLGLVLGDLGVPGGQQRVPSEHRVRLGDLAAEELDRESGHARDGNEPARPAKHPAGTNDRGGFLDTRPAPDAGCPQNRAQRGFEDTRRR